MKNLLVGTADKFLEQEQVHGRWKCVVDRGGSDVNLPAGISIMSPIPQLSWTQNMRRKGRVAVLKRNTGRQAGEKNESSQEIYTGKITKVKPSLNILARARTVGRVETRGAMPR